MFHTYLAKPYMGGHITGSSIHSTGGYSAVTIATTSSSFPHFYYDYALLVDCNCGKHRWRKVLMIGGAQPGYKARGH